MAVLRRDFDSYKLQYTASKQTANPASISCFQGSAVVGTIGFCRSPAELVVPFNHPTLGILLYYLIDQYPHVVDILREEGPLQLYLQESGGWGAVLTKNMEPVGEGEWPTARV